MEEEVRNTSIRNIVIGNSKRVLKKHVKHVVTAPPAPVDSDPMIFVWGALFLIIAIIISVAIFNNVSEAKEEARLKLQEDEERKQRELRWEREEKEKQSKEREQVKKEKMRKIEIENQRLAKIEYQKQRSAKEATKDSLSDFV